MLKTRNDDVIGTAGPVRFMRLPDVEKATGMCRSAIYGAIAAGTFPKPIRLGPKSVAWTDYEIAEWQTARIAERDAAMEAA